MSCRACELCQSSVLSSEFGGLSFKRSVFAHGVCLVSSQATSLAIGPELVLVTRREFRLLTR